MQGFLPMTSGSIVIRSSCSIAALFVRLTFIGGLWGFPHTGLSCEEMGESADSLT